MGGLFGGGGSKNKGSRTTTETTSGTTTAGATTTPAAAAAAPAPPLATLAAGPTPELNRRRPSFLVTPTMIDDAYGSPTGRSETFG